jgi:hypothetical protein
MTEGDGEMGKLGAKPKRGDALKMITYFKDTIASGAIPTFSEAAERLGCGNVELLRAAREDGTLGDAYRECRMLLFDHLLVGGLCKRFDSSLVKLMLGELDERGEDEGGASELSVTVRVIGRGEAALDG